MLPRCRSQRRQAAQQVGLDVFDIVEADGDPPERYQLDYRVTGLRLVDEELKTVKNHRVEIVLPATYPRLPPQCRMLTPVFHPNIAPHAICIGDHWSAGEPLVSIVARIAEMITYQSYNTKSPLNGEAAPEWVQLLPPGPALQGRDGRAWKMNDVAAVIAASETPFALDYEHVQDLRAINGEEAPAAGWVLT